MRTTFKLYEVYVSRNTYWLSYFVKSELNRKMKTLNQEKQGNYLWTENFKKPNMNKLIQ